MSSFLNKKYSCRKTPFLIIKIQMIKVAIVGMALFTVTANVVLTEEKNNNIFSITPAITISWYPYAELFEESSTKTIIDFNNFGMSITMGLKLFDKVESYLNLKIDDPTFQKLVDFAGYITAYHFLLKFDYHSFGGTITWTGNTPNPIPKNEYSFRNQWSNITLLYRFDHFGQATLNREPNFFDYLFWGTLSTIGFIGTGSVGALGIGYASFNMPLEYQIKPGSRLSTPGFGLIKGESWGITLLWDTLTWYMELPASERKGLRQYLWAYLDWFNGFSFIGKAETETQAIAWMSNANGVSVDGKIKPSYSIIKAVLGIQHIWDMGEKGRIGIAIGAELLSETIDASNNDILIHFWSRHIGPAVRISARW